MNMVTEDTAAMPHVVQDHIIMLGHKELERESKTLTKHTILLRQEVSIHIFIR